MTLEEGSVRFSDLLRLMPGMKLYPVRKGGQNFQLERILLYRVPTLALNSKLVFRDFQ